MSLEQIRDFVIREFLPGQDPSELGSDLPLISSGIIDSVGTLKLVLYLEQAFGIELSAQDIAGGHLETLQKICDLVRLKQAGLPPTAAVD